MDHGKLTDHNGKNVDFRNVILIMTTNAGRRRSRQGGLRLPPGPSASGDDTEAINKLFAPEFRNRLDSIISFGNLPREVIMKVVDKFVAQLEGQLASARSASRSRRRRGSGWSSTGLRRDDGRAPDGSPDPVVDQDAARREVLFGRLKDGGTVTVIVEKDVDGLDKLGFEYVSAPGQARQGQAREAHRSAEEGQSASPARRRSPRRRSPVTAPTAAGTAEAAGVRTVPKVPLVRA